VAIGHPDHEQSPKRELVRPETCGRKDENVDEHIMSHISVNVLDCQSDVWVKYSYKTGHIQQNTGQLRVSDNLACHYDKMSKNEGLGEYTARAELTDHRFMSPRKFTSSCALGCSTQCVFANHGGVVPGLDVVVREPKVFRRKF
jgi:hypothetical protein